MKKLLYILFALVVAQGIHAQEKSVNHQNIRFTYEFKSFYIIGKDGVFANENLFAKNFSTLNYTMAKSPSGITMPFIAFRDFTGADRKRLLSMLYQNNVLVNGFYDSASNTTTLDFIKDDAEVKKAFKALGENYQVSRYSIKMDFNAKTEFIAFPKSKYTVEFQDIATDAVFLSDKKLQATFSDKKDKLSRQLSVAFQEGLSNKVTPGEIFTNNEYGISKVESYGCTKTLTAVKYE